MTNEMPQIDYSEVNPVYPGPDAPPEFTVELDDDDIGMIAALIARRSYALGGKDVPSPNAVHFFGEVDEWYESRYDLFSNASAGSIGLTTYDVRKINSDLIARQLGDCWDAVQKCLKSDDPGTARHAIEVQRRYLSLAKKANDFERIAEGNDP